MHWFLCFNDTATTEIYTYLHTLSRHDALPIFTILVDVLGVDWPARPKRFDVVYHLLSMKLNQRIRIKVQTDEETPVPSVTPVFRSEEHTSELQSLMRI